MTDQISSLLHEEAEGILVPAAPAVAIVARGRQLRRRRRLTGVGAVAVSVAAAAAVAGAVLVLPHAAPDGSGGLAAAVAPNPEGWAVAQGSTVHLGNGRTVEVPGKVKAMYYTSAGVMVRTGRTAYTDAEHSNYFVLPGSGTVRDFSLDLGDKKPGTDPTLPYLAYVMKDGDTSHWELVLRDVRTGEVATRVPFEGAFTWGGWNAPPTALSGDFAYVGMDKATLAINWRTGAVTASDVLPASRMPEVSGGRELIDPMAGVDVDALAQKQLREMRFEQTQEFRVVNVADGSTLRTIGVDPEGWPRLSPDGSHVALPPMGSCDAVTNECHYDDPEGHVISVDTGADHSFRLEVGAFGWTPDGRLLLVRDTAVQSCDADTGACTTTPVELSGSGPIRVSGNDNES